MKLMVLKKLEMVKNLCSVEEGGPPSFNRNSSGNYSKSQCKVVLVDQIYMLVKQSKI